MDIKDYLRIVRRRWPVILLATGITVLFAVGFAPRPPDRFQSDAEIIVKDPPMIILGGGDRPRLVEESITAATQINLIKQREVLEFALAQDDRLAKHMLERFGKPKESLLPLREEEELERIRSLPPGERERQADAEKALVETIAQKKTDLTGVMNELRSWIVVERDRDTQIVRVSAQHENAVVAEFVASAVVEGFLAYSVAIPQRRIKLAIERITKEQLEPAQRERDRLRADRDRVRQELLEAQRPPEPVSDDARFLERQVETLAAEAKSLREQREALEARNEDARRELATGIVSGSEAEANVAPPRTVTARLLEELQRLELEYRQSLYTRTPAHPGVRELVKQMEYQKSLVDQYSESEKTLTQIDRKISRARALERDQRARDGLVAKEGRIGRELTAAQAALTAERRKTSPLPSDPKRLAELQQQEARLAGAHEAKEKQSQTIQAEVDKLDISRKTFTPLVQKVSAARPAHSITPQRQASWAMALVVGLAIGIGAAYFLEYMTSTLRTEQDIRRYVNLPMLGVILHIREADQRLLLNVAPKSPLSEVFNTIGTLMESYAAEYGAKVFLVASSKAAEGKSTVNSNIAVALARGGRRVILVDADMRKAVLHKFFNVDNAQGLSTWLSAAGRPGGENDAPPALDGFLRPTEIEGLRVLPAGPHPQNPVGLLKSAAFKETLDRLRSMADIVLIDVPPVNLAVDTMIVSSLADAVVMLVSANETQKDEVTYAKRVIEAARGKLIGCILNKATYESHGYYYYYYYYYDSYKYYRDT